MESLHDIVPLSLRECPQWVVWRFVERGGKRTKVPVDPTSGAAASSTDASTWASFDEALAATTRLPAIEGVGFVFTDADPFCGIDLDKCIDPDTGEMLWWGRSIVESLDSYAEISPSGLGVKIFVRARKPGERCKTGHESGAIEMYDAGRFFTVTGSAVGGRREVEDRQQQVEALYADVFGATPSNRATVSLPLPSPVTVQEPLTDDEILKLASNPRRPKGERFAALFAGNWNLAFNSASEADSSVVWTLAYYTKDAAQIDRIFRRSKLLRPKWDEQHGAKTYGEMTIDKALARVTGQYVRRKRKRGASTAPKPVAVPSEATDRPLPPLYVTREVARLFVAESRRIVYWRGVFHLYTGTRYRVLAEDELVARIARFITDVGWWSRPARMVGDGQWEEGAQAHPDHDGLMIVLELVTPKTGEIREILLQLKIDYLSDTVNSRSWIGNGEHPRADELVACRNGLLHLPSMAMRPHSDAFFSLNAVGYDHAPDAPAPERWEAFLREVFGEDDSAIGTLQELFGYFLLPDTRQQKIGLMVGPKRSGKGTIGRVLTAMLGGENVCGPTLGSLCTNFGLWPLLDKPLAIISDARLSGRADQAVVVERLLSISGEDSITVDRKHLAPWTGTLPTRFLILTNELPRLCDASGALAGRFIVLCLTRSWYGREDLSLTDRLLAELPGILNWSIEGWRRLRARGHFVQPKSSEEARRQLEDLGSPISAFLQERCVVGPGESVEAHELFVAWQGYCHDSGRVNPGTIQSFGRDLRAAVPGLRLSQPRLADGRVRLYEGVGLLHGGSGAARLARMAREAWHCGKLGDVVA